MVIVVALNGPNGARGHGAHLLVAQGPKFVKGQVKEDSTSAFQGSRQKRDSVTQDNVKFSDGLNGDLGVNVQ